MHLDEITPRENNRTAMLAAVRTVLDHIESGAIETTYFDVQNSGSCAVSLGWKGSPTRASQRLYEQVRALWPDGKERLMWRAHRSSKRAADMYVYVVDLDGCKISVDFLKPHEHREPKYTSADGIWRCGSCGGRLSKKAVRELGVEGPVL